MKSLPLILWLVASTLIVLILAALLVAAGRDLEFVRARAEAADTTPAEPSCQYHADTAELLIDCTVLPTPAEGPRGYCPEGFVQTQKIDGPERTLVRCRVGGGE